MPMHFPSAMILKRRFNWALQEKWEPAPRERGSRRVWPRWAVVLVTVIETAKLAKAKNASILTDCSQERKRSCPCPGELDRRAFCGTLVKKSHLQPIPMSHTQKQSPIAALQAVLRLVGHLTNIHVRVFFGAPPFRRMKDSVFTFIAFAAIAAVAAVSNTVIDSLRQSNDMAGMMGTMDALLIEVAPLAAILALMMISSKASNHLLATFFACSTVVDVANLGIFLAGYSDAPVSAVSWFSKTVLALLCWRAYANAPREVRQRGYGLSEDEI